MLSQKLRISAASLVLLAVHGCVANRYRVPIGNFQTTVQQGTSAVATFYGSRNTYERQLYLNDIATNPDLEIAPNDARGKPTPLGKPAFSPDSINARLNALDLVGVYANRLADLAGSTAPASFNDSATLLGQNLQSLDQTFQQLQGTGDPTANVYIAPISALVGAIGQMILERKRDEMITQAINTGSDPVNKILTQARDDLDQVFSPLLLTGDKEKLASLELQYNTTRKTLSYAERRALLQEIETVMENMQNNAIIAPSSLVSAMLDANQALLKFAKSPRKPADFTEFTTQLGLFSQRVEFFAGQIKELVHS